jgi:hypothetical protein
MPKKALKKEPLCMFLEVHNVPQEERVITLKVTQVKDPWSIYKTPLPAKKKAKK